MTPFARPALTLVLAVTVLSGCAQSANQPPAPSATTATTTTEGGNSGGGGGTPAPVGYPNSPAEYAKAAVSAWAGRDLQRVDNLEVSGGILHTMLACNGCYEIHFVLSTCEGAAGSSYCLFFNGAGDELTIRVQNSALGQPHAVVLGGTFKPVTFPSDNQAYAQEALDAWLSRNDVRLELLTLKHMTSGAVDGLGANRNSTWTFDHGEGAAGSAYLTWHDTAGHKLTFRFVNGPAAPTLGPASQHRITEIIYQA
jgi:hypothetical protein